LTPLAPIDGTATSLTAIKYRFSNVNVALGCYIRRDRRDDRPTRKRNRNAGKACPRLPHCVGLLRARGRALPRSSHHPHRAICGRRQFGCARPAAGAGSRLGIELAAKAAPDGYTLLLADMPHTIIPAIQKGVHYDPVRDFTSIGLIGTASMFFFVNPELNAGTVADFVALAKTEPEKITIASGGIGSATHLTAELFQVKAGIKLVHVPFRGAGPAMNDLLAGHVQSGFTTLATASSVLDRVRALAIASETRLAALVNVPTFREAGIDLVVEHWWGVLAPAGLPPEIAARLTGDLEAILDSPELTAHLAALGITASHASPAQFRALIESDAARWAQIVKSAGISIP
jgi:tripartite-type tricarboxylate transporter receptor subunit TctC